MRLQNLLINRLFPNTKINNTLTNQTLLTDSEINQLINAAPTAGITRINNRAQQGRTGEQMSTHIGSGSDFAEVRAYHAGDDLRHIDWRATARSQIPLVRTYHRELSQPLCLLIDRRATMRFATRVRLKVTQALRIALWIGGREARLGREISAVLLDTPCHWLPAQQGLSSLKLIAKLGNRPCPPTEPDSDQKNDPKTNWNTIFSGIMQHIPQGSELILLSDFIGLGDEDNKMLLKLGKHCSTRAIQLFDPIEVDPAEVFEPLAQTFNPMGILATTMQLQWGQKVRCLAASEEFKELLEIRSVQMRKHFQQADIDYDQLSVEQNEFSDFPAERYQ